MNHPQDVLIVEDDYLQAYSIQTQLKSLNYTVSGIIDNGEEAAEFAKKHKPDIIIMDLLLLGEINGAETVSRIYESYDPYIIYITGSSGSDSRKWINDTSYVDMIVKPFTWKSLEISLNKCGVKPA